MNTPDWLRDIFRYTRSDGNRKDHFYHLLKMFKWDGNSQDFERLGTVFEEARCGLDSEKECREHWEEENAQSS